MLRGTPPVKLTLGPLKLCAVSTRRWQTTLPPLYQQQDDGSETPIPEQALYGYTRTRTLFRDPAFVQTRTRTFHLPALLSAAVRAAGPGATRCTKLVRGIETPENRTLLLTINNGRTLIAKLPTPAAGPAFYTVASEVATGHFLRTVLKLPVPKVLAYSVDARNSVQAEYIIGEPPTGVPVGALWGKWGRSEMLDLAEELVRLERRMCAVSFNGQGGVYLKKHLEKRGVAAKELELRVDQVSNEFEELEELEEEIERNNDGESQRDGLGGFGTINVDAANLFALGPVVAPGLWSGSGADVTLARGPWSSPLDYLDSLVANELIRLQSAQSPSSPASHQLLTNLNLVLPHILPRHTRRATLAHQSLTSFNVFLNPITRRISCLTNWQRANTSFPLFQATLPYLLRHEIVQEGVVAKGMPETGVEAYLTMLGKRDPARYRALTEPGDRESVRGLAEMVPRVREPGERRVLEVMVERIVASWEGVMGLRARERSEFRLPPALKDRRGATGVSFEQRGPPPPCPVSLNKRGRAEGQRSLERYQRMLDCMQRHGLPMPDAGAGGGTVLARDYDAAARANRVARREFVEEGESEAERRVREEVWPYEIDDGVEEGEVDGTAERVANKWWKIWG